MSSEEETDGLNVTIESTDDGSLYVPTPQRMVRENARVVRNVSSNIICFMDLNQFDKFIKQVNEIRCCTTPGCKGALTPVYVRSVGLGGTVSISCTCNGCGNRGAIFETSSKYELGSATEISVAIQVAFCVCYKLLTLHCYEYGIADTASYCAIAFNVYSCGPSFGSGIILDPKLNLC